MTVSDGSCGQAMTDQLALALARLLNANAAVDNAVAYGAPSEAAVEEQIAAEQAALDLLDKYYATVLTEIAVPVSAGGGFVVFA